MLRSRLLLTGGGYKIRNSLRFNDDDSAYLSRTFASAGNSKTMTLSMWVKRGNLGINTYLLDQGAGDQDYIAFTSGDALQMVFGNGAGGNKVTSALFRDPAAHYHLVSVVDTSNATAGDRIRIYVNGTRVTSFSTSVDPALNYNLGAWNTAIAHAIGRRNSGSLYCDMLLSEVNFIDGQALDASYFGKTDTVTGAWIPKKYSGSYGTNGFYLPFNDATSLTTLGYDRSGNGNNWTLNNHTTSDQLTDTPTNNYCALSSIDNAGYTLSDGNLRAVYTNSDVLVRGSYFASSGKRYFEFTSNLATNYSDVGVANTSAPVSGANLNQNANLWLCRMSNGDKANGVFTAYGSAFGSGDVMMCAIDVDAGKIWWGKNGTWFGGGDPAAGTNAAFTNLAGGTYAPCVESSFNNSDVTANFGQRPFAYTPPTGFKSLCTDNLPVPSIKKPALYFKPLLYTGNGASRSLTGVGFQPDLVWIKGRSGATSHMLTDAVRGATKRLSSDSAGAEATDSNGLTSFDADGLSLGTDANYNANTATYVAWCFKKGVTPGFDIVPFTKGVGSESFAHALGVTPAMMILMGRSYGTAKWVWHQHLSNPAQSFLFTNTTDAEAANANAWDNQAPTSSVFYQKEYILTNGQTGLALLFAEVPGFSRFGKYTGNGSADGPFVWCGFKPKFVMIKRIDAAGYGWAIEDTVRDVDNPVDSELVANVASAETSGSAKFDAVANGFKLRTTDPAYNASGGTYIFIAFAEHPFKYARAA